MGKATGQRNMVEKYIPEKGDIVWLSFDPTRGHEQKGKRPGLVISSKLFNQKSGLCYVCPITNTRKEYVYRIEITEPLVRGFAMVDQLKSVDWKERKPEYICSVTKSVLDDVVCFVKTVIE